MLILGIDPGTATTGYGLIKVEKSKLNVIDFGLIETDKVKTPGERLVTIHEKLSLLIDDHSPDIIAIEKLFFYNNQKTAIRVGQAQGVMIFSATLKSKSVVEYAPGMIKKVVSGNGRANKKDVQIALRKILGNKVKSKKNKKTHFDNAADALAVAYCHAVEKCGFKM